MTRPRSPGTIEKVLDDPALAEDLRRKGLERAKAFTWEEGAHKLMTVINNAGAQR